MECIKIGKRLVGEGCSTFIIAEAGTNHNADLKTALWFVRLAKEIGADAVKFQSFKAEDIASKHYAPKMFTVLKEYTLKKEWHIKLKRYADKLGIIFLSTPFNEEAVDLLDAIGVPAFKVASGDLTHIALLKHIALKNKPIILSTGGAGLKEIRGALGVIKKQGNNKVILMHCISRYPSKIEDANIRAITTLKDRFHLPVGYSDHSPGCIVPLASVSLGASVIEKHLTFDRKLKGPDHHFALEIGDFKEMVDSIRILEKALGDGRKCCLGIEKDEMKLARRSIIAATHIPKNSIVKEGMLRFLRPGTGISPMFLQKVIGRKAKVNIPEGKMIAWKMFDKVQK